MIVIEDKHIISTTDEQERQIKAILAPALVTPDNIKWCHGGLLFNDRQVLQPKFGLYSVTTYSVDIMAGSKPTTNLPLIPVAKPEAGGWYYCSDEKDDGFAEAYNYHLYLTETEYCRVNSYGGIERASVGWRHYWKVQF